MKELCHNVCSVIYGDATEFSRSVAVRSTESIFLIRSLFSSSVTDIKTLKQGRLLEIMAFWRGD